MNITVNDDDGDDIIEICPLKSPPFLALSNFMQTIFILSIYPNLSVEFSTKNNDHFFV